MNVNRFCSRWELAPLSEVVNGDFVGKFRGAYSTWVLCDGAYVLFSNDEVDRYNKLIGEFFPAKVGQVVSVGRDWLGRFFAIDKSGGEDDGSVLLLDPCTGDIFVIPVDFIAFHDDILVDQLNAALEFDKFVQWVDNNRRPDRGECVGYKVPLVLGGLDEPNNQELANVDVYFDILLQVTLQTRGGWS
jgi:Domain of unknown function (DUF1851)